MTVVTLSRQFEAWAAHEVEAGRASDVEALAQEALADFQRRRAEEELAAFRESLDLAEESIRQNGGTPAEIVFEEVRARMRARR